MVVSVVVAVDVECCCPPTHLRCSALLSCSCPHWPALSLSPSPSPAFSLSSSLAYALSVCSVHNVCLHFLLFHIVVVAVVFLVAFVLLYSPPGRQTDSHICISSCSCICISSSSCSYICLCISSCMLRIRIRICSFIAHARVSPTTHRATLIPPWSWSWPALTIIR